MIFKNENGPTFWFNNKEAEETYLRLLKEHTDLVNSFENTFVNSVLEPIIHVEDERLKQMNRRQRRAYLRNKNKK